nr:EOG090X0J8E [Macrothrix elegans]
MDNLQNHKSLGVGTFYDVKEPMLYGGSHPLEEILPKHKNKQEELDMKMLRNMQGLHAPLRLHMEKAAVKDIGHLPCLFRHNALQDALTGRDTTFEFEDFLNTPQDMEAMGHPHLMIERHLNML